MKEYQPVKMSAIGNLTSNNKFFYNMSDNNTRFTGGDYLDMVLNLLYIAAAIKVLFFM